MGKRIKRKIKPDDKITWIVDKGIIGPMWFTFDGVKEYSLFRDYPSALTPEEVEIFKKECPYWADFFKDKGK